MSRAHRVLVVEDEPDVAELIRYHLAKDGYAVLVAPTGAEVLRRARDAQPDVILLDVMLPRLDGWDVCRRLKAEADTRAIPVIIVTGRVDEADRIHGFDLGAEDYVTKPFSPRELVARVRAVLRRATTPEDSPRRLTIGDLEIDRERFAISVRGHRVLVTPKEFELLATLATIPGRVFRRDELLDRVWGTAFVEPRTVDVHLARLRAKLVASCGYDLPVETVRGGRLPRSRARRARFVTQLLHAAYAVATLGHHH
jgi:DNA-binding response OmpR family regulator